MEKFKIFCEEVQIQEAEEQVGIALREAKEAIINLQEAKAKAKAKLSLLQQAKAKAIAAKDAGMKYGKKGVALAKKNPKSAIAIGVGAAGAGVGAALLAKRRRAQQQQ